MDLTAFAASLQTTLGTELPRVMGSIAILILGWLLALVFRAAVRKVLRVLAVNQRIKDSTGASLDAESPIEVAAFWFVLLATLVAVLNVMDLQALSMPLANLMNDVVGYLPHLVAGMVLVLVAWILATVVRALATRALASTTLDEKLSASAGMQPISTHAGNVLFWVVNLMFLPAVLNALRLNGLLEPVSRMVDKALGVVPNGVAAALIAAVGYMVARVLRGLVSSLLMAAGTDRINAQIGLEHSVRLSALAGNLAFIFVFIPSAIAALDALGIEAISRPATAMLTQVLSAVPHVMAAVVILLLTWYLSRFAAGLVSSLLESAGVDGMAHKMGLGQAASGPARPSRLAAGLLMFFAMLFAVSEAADQLGFSQVRGFAASFITFAGDIVLGSAILVVGFWLANQAYDALQRTDGQTDSPLAGVARIAILGLVLGMGLRAMGIANDIVQLAFGLTLGAVAVAVALSFGLGGREAAAKLMEHWLSKWRRD